MSTSICLPAHILDAHITPRAREVLMLLASQTSAKSPTLWICQAALAKRLRCSVATIARSIQKLLEAKLIAETGRLHEGRYKYYHVRWSKDENIKAASKKITKPIRKVLVSSPLEKKNPPSPLFQRGNFEDEPASPLTLTPQSILKDSRIAYFAEMARKRYEENRRMHQATLASLR